MHSLGKTRLAFDLLRFVLQRQICLLLQVSLDFLFLHSSHLWQPTPIFLPGKSCGQWSLRAAVHRVVQSRTQLKRLSMHECTGEGNGNPLQYSCLENPRDRAAWWAAICGVAQSRTRLKQCSSRPFSIMLNRNSKEGHCLFPKLEFLRAPLVAQQ